MKVLVRTMGGRRGDFEVFDKVWIIHTQATDAIQWIGAGNFSEQIDMAGVDITITILKKHHAVLEEGGTLDIRDR